MKVNHVNRIYYFIHEIGFIYDESKLSGILELCKSCVITNKNIVQSHNCMVANA